MMTIIAWVGQKVQFFQVQSDGYFVLARLLAARVSLSTNLADKQPACLPHTSHFDYDSRSAANCSNSSVQTIKIITNFCVSFSNPAGISR